MRCGGDWWEEAGVECSGAALGRCTIVGACALKLDGLLGDVDLGRALDGVRWCVECSCDNLPGSCVSVEPTCVAPNEDGAWGGVGRTIPVYMPTGALSLRASLPFSVDVCELADLRLT